MSTKPLEAGRFAVDGSEIDATNISAPSGSLRNTGFPDNYVPPAAEFNYLENIAYRWRQWLFDGDCAFRNLSATNTLQVAGVTTLQGSTVTAGLTVGGQSLTFSDFAFTADSTTDQVTATSNPLTTGDGPVRVSNSGGGLPGGLSAGTDYYWIKADANHGKLATTRVNAIAGTAIDLTTNGTGTQTLLHQAGTTRVTDAEVTRNLTVDGNLTVNGSTFTSTSYTIMGSQGIEQIPDVTKVSRNGGRLIFLGTRTGTSAILFPLALPVGTTVSKVRFDYDRDGNQLAFSIVGADLNPASIPFLQTIVNDTTSTGSQSVTSTNFAVNGSGHPTGGSGSLIIRSDRLYWIEAECAFTSGSPTIQGFSVNPP